MSSARNVKKVENSRRVGKARSGYNKGTIRVDLRYLVVSKDVRRHRLISIDYITTLRCHGRGREFESRRPRHSFLHLLATGQRCRRAVAGRVPAPGFPENFAPRD